MPHPPQVCNETVRQQVYHFEVDVIAGDVNAAAHRYDENLEYKVCTILQLVSCTERCSAKSIRDSHVKTGFTSIILPIITPSAPRSRRS